MKFTKPFCSLSFAACLAVVPLPGASTIATSLQLPSGAYIPEPDPAQIGTMPRGAGERIFRNGFDLPTPVTHVTTYDEREEGYAGTSFHYDGVTYRELNEVSGLYPGPDNEPFGPGPIDQGGLGNQFIIEDATFLFDDFPEFGSAPNVLNFGDLLFSNPGPNLSLGALASAWMDLDEATDSVSMALVYYENGPWDGIEVRLDAYLGDDLVGSDQFVITSVDPDGRDNITSNRLAIDGVRFDTLHLYSVRQSDGEFTAPRIMIDDLELTRMRYLDTRVTTYDEREEGYAGTSFHYDGITYREVNEVSGLYPGPDNEPFGPGPVDQGGLGNQFVIEDATLLFDDFPEFGSAPNVLNFGDLLYSTPGPNLSLGALASAWMDLDELADAVSMALVYYENGPWDGIEVRLDAYLGDTLVGNDQFVITSTDPDGRDNITTNRLAIDSVRFDTLHLYSVRQSDGEFTAPRIMIDDLELTVDFTPEPR